jgi:hypothetical protein
MKKEKMNRLCFFFPFVSLLNVSLYRKREEEFGQMKKMLLMSLWVSFWYYPTVNFFVKASRSLIDMIFEPKIEKYIRRCLIKFQPDLMVGLIVMPDSVKLDNK